MGAQTPGMDAGNQQMPRMGAGGGCGSPNALVLTPPHTLSPSLGGPRA